MTLLDAPPAAPVAPAPRQRRSARRVVAVLAVAALVAGGIVGGVAVRDAVLLSQVHVFLAAKPITCADPSDVTTVARGGGLSAEDTFAVPAVEGVRSLDCELAVVVQNGSDDDVAVERARFPLTGPESMAGLRIDRSLTQGLLPSTTADRADTLFDYEHEGPLLVGAHDVEVLRFHLVSDGCRQAGATTTFDDAPTLTLSSGIVTTDVDRQGVGFGVVGAAAAGRPCL